MGDDHYNGPRPVHVRMRLDDATPAVDDAIFSKAKGRFEKPDGDLLRGYLKFDPRAARDALVADGVIDAACRADDVYHRYLQIVVKETKPMIEELNRIMRVPTTDLAAILNQWREVVMIAHSRGASWCASERGALEEYSDCGRGDS